MARSLYIFRCLPDAIMTDLSQDTANSNPELANDAQSLLLLLRRKQGSWVEWGKACQALQKMGYTAQQIFEETGFEPIHQNQVIVGSQVYTTMVSSGVADEVQRHFERTGSDTLYEFRILTQTERANAASFVLAHQLDSTAARDVARAIKEFSRLRTLPDGFSHDTGDALAYQYWRLARQMSDMQERSLLIAKGLKYAHSDAARRQVETLLTDFTVVPQRQAPRLPVYRLDSEEELPRIIPVVGKFPLPAKDFKSVPLTDEIGAFRMVQFSGQGAWIPVPGWLVILAAQDPVGFLCNSGQLPNQLTSQGEEVLVVVDRAQREWDANSYFIVEQAEQLHMQWFDEETDTPLLGKVILIMRPKRILDEELTKDVWQIDE
jgi:Rubisco Assembly chaperone C-terminal domain/Rubisco accumulation factor 1 alpha helical domain/Rubisco accumulation factor 1 helix turn helix domain